MSDPISAKIASQALTKAFENSQAETSKAPAAQGGNNFSEMLGQADAHAQIMDILGVEQKSQILPGGKVNSLSAADIPLEQGMQSVNPPNSTGGEKVMSMLSDFNNQQSQMDLLVNQIMYGDKKFSNQELMAIQAHVFHIAQMTEMTVKSVELAVSSFKGVMNTQIQ